MSLIQSFPGQFTPRKIQEEIIGEIEARLNSGYKKIVLCAPTGVGKSLVGTAVCRHFGRSFTVTASKHLQDQYIRSVPILKPVKGKQNFACLQLMSAKKVEDPREAKRDGLTCEKGECVKKTTEDGKTIMETCALKPLIADVAKGNTGDGQMCHYYMQKYEALTSPHSLWNYHAFFQTMKFNRKLFAEYLDRKVSVFDEAHKIEDQIIQFIGFDIFQAQLDECQIDPGRYDLDDIDSVVGMIDDMARSYAEKIKHAEESAPPGGDPDHDLIARLTARYERAAQARVDIHSDRGNFVVNEPARDLDGKITSISIKPVDVAGFASQFFETEYQMFMSATIDKSSFCENMGLKADGVAFVDTPRSPFPAESRAVEMLNVRRLNYRSSEADEVEVIRAIDRIMDGYPDQRGLILTSSIPRCHKIVRHLSPKNTRRVRMCHSMNRGDRTQDEVIAEHAADPSGVLLSSSLWEGVDLKDDLSRFQIVAKVPYPNYTEKRIRAKMKRFPLWYTSQTLTKMLQGFGRSVRGEGDWAKTYVLDAAVSNVLYQGRRMIPHAYHDVLGMDGGGGS